jgi:hypothetical protein
MATSDGINQAVNSALLTLLRFHVPFGAFEELAKHVYVQTAMEDFPLPGKKPSLSRASILTGLTRKDVQRLAAEPEPARAAGQEAFNRAARVLGGWARDPDFHTVEGRPAALDPQDGPASFAELVRRYSGDMPARAMLDELMRVGAVRRRDDGRIELVQRSYVPAGDAAEKLGFLGADVADLIATIDHNLQHGGSDPRYQRKVMYRSVPAHIRPAFRQLSAGQAQALLERLDAWLAERDTGNPPDQPDAPRVRMGLGIYYFEAPAEPLPRQER